MLYYGWCSGRRTSCDAPRPVDMGTNQSIFKTLPPLTDWIFHVWSLPISCCPSLTFSRKSSPISIRAPGDWSMRNLSTGSIVYLDPSSPADTPSPKSLHAHIHRCRSALSLLKHSLWPHLLFHFTQFTGQAPFLWPIPFGLVKVSGNIVRKWVFLPLIRFSLESCECRVSVLCV